MTAEADEAFLTGQHCSMQKLKQLLEWSGSNATRGAAATAPPSAYLAVRTVHTCRSCAELTMIATRAEQAAAASKPSRSGAKSECRGNHFGRLS